MHHEIQAPPHSPLHNELRALSQEHHSPSSAAIHAALLIGARTEVGYGEIYTIIPRAETAHFATLAAQEMEARCPYLLAAIRRTIAANRTSLCVEIVHDQPESISTPLSAHARLDHLPHLIGWLLRQPRTALQPQDPP